MRIYCLILALLLAVGAAFATSRRGFVTVQPGATTAAEDFSVITNVAGYACVVWAPVNGNFASGYWTNLMGGTVPNLTNATSPATLVNDGVDAKDFLAFDGSNDYQTAGGFASLGNHYEWGMVLAITNNGTDNTILAPDSGSYAGLHQHVSAGNLISISPAGNFVWCTPLTNKWTVIMGSFGTNVNNICFWTNGISVGRAADLGAGGTLFSNLTVGVDFNLADQFSQFNIAALWMFSTNFGAGDAAGSDFMANSYRSNIYWRVTNYWPTARP